MWGLEPQVLEKLDASAVLGMRAGSADAHACYEMSPARRRRAARLQRATRMTRQFDPSQFGIDRTCPLTEAAMSRGPEHLVGVGFRCWLKGYETGEINCWEHAWTTYSAALGTVDAKRALGDLSCWVRSIRGRAQRRIETFPPGCRGFCRDECVAISMIASCQHNACPALRACAFTLLGCPAIDEVVQGAESFAETLRSLRQVLSPASICSVAQYAPPHSHATH